MQTTHTIVMSTQRAITNRALSPVPAKKDGKAMVSHVPVSKIVLPHNCVSPVNSSGELVVFEFLIPSTYKSSPS